MISMTTVSTLEAQLKGAKQHVATLEANARTFALKVEQERLSESNEERSKREALQLVMAGTDSREVSAWVGG